MDDFQTRLIKLLNLTTSPFDGEALNSIRAANKELAEKNITWEQVFNLIESQHGYNTVDYYVRLMRQKDTEINDLKKKVREAQSELADIKELQKTQPNFKEITIKLSRRLEELRLKNDLLMREKRSREKPPIQTTTSKTFDIFS